MTVRLGLPILCLVLTNSTWADDPAKPAEPAASESPRKPADAPDKPTSDAKRSVAPLDLDLLRSLEKQSAPIGADEDPLERVDHLMRDVQDRLAKSDPGDETQNLQKSIVGDLDTLIAQLKKGGGCPSCGAAQCSKHGKKRPTSSQQPGQQAKPGPASEPKEGLVAAGPGPVSNEQKADGVRVVRNVWGHLPEKLREEMQQASGDTGLPKYRSLIELYFRAIAEQTESRRTATER